MTDEFSEKTNQLLDYIEKTYLKVKIVPYQLPNYLTVQDMALDHHGDRLVQKMRLDTTQKVMIIFKNLKQFNLAQAQAMDTGFNRLFAEGTATPTFSDLVRTIEKKDNHDDFVQEPELPNLDDEVEDISM